MERLNDLMHDPQKHVSYLQQVLSADKKPLGLFVGAGCPTAIRRADDTPLIPDVTGMTVFIRAELLRCPKFKDSFQIVERHFDIDGHPDPTIEDILTHIRALHAVAGNDKIRDLTAEQLATLDEAICSLIQQSVDQELPDAETPYHHVASWMGAIQRESAVEVFTTNYDLLIEQAFECCRVPYFDGFAGARRPIFDARTIEEDHLPSRWGRLWKLHGSINWYQDARHEIFRATTSEPNTKRVIHPSHLKYQESRRMPYLAMIDRLREFLKDPNSALVLCGYSFRDEHINETIVRGLQYTQTAVAFALLFETLDAYEEVAQLAQRETNLTVLARDGGIIGGQEVRWLVQPSEAVSDSHDTWVTWGPAVKGNRPAEFRLGDFAVFGRFLRELTATVWRPANET